MSIKTIPLLLVSLAASAATPIEFGLAEFRKAVEERNLNPKRFRLLTEYSMVLPSDAFHIQGNIIRGGNQRGLMYGLLEAADQVRRQGRLSQLKVIPATPIRGIRRFVHNADLEKSWYHDRDYWRAWFEMLARNRFNRFNLVFAHQTDYLAPPYPYWVSVAEFPQIRVPGLSDADRERNLDTLRFISQTASDYGIDFALGVWEHNIQKGMKPSVAGLTDANIGPYSYAALKLVLASCPAIKSVQMRTNSESGIPAERQVVFYRDWIFRALADSGRLVQLDLRSWVMQKGLLEAALDSKVPLRLSSKYWAEDLGRPYQPAETWPGYSFLNFLEKPAVPDRDRPWQFFWELWGLGSHRLLQWGDPDYVRRAVRTFTLSNSAGFEIDPPLAQKGFGNRPGEWTVPHASKYEWGRYWLFYLLWGRLSYKPDEPERLWMSEFEQRYSKAAAKDAFEATQNASHVLNELVAVHLADPNMYIWPEINPGGLIRSYLEVRPSDFRFVAGFRENAANRLKGEPSAKQTARETAALFDDWASKTSTALGRVSNALGNANKEWMVTRRDLEVLAGLARFHARRQIAADHLAWYEATGDASALEPARRELQSALALWQSLVKLGEAYQAEMAFGPDDVGHWQDKIVYVQHDLNTIGEIIDTHKRYGHSPFAFDFQAPVAEPRPGYRQTAYVLQNNVAFGWRAAAPDTLYDDSSGYGWIGPGQREAQGMPLASYHEVRAVARNPRTLPGNSLLGDFIRGSGAHTFRVKTGDGQFKALLIRPDGSTDERVVQAQNGVTEVTTPEGDWQLAGIILQPVKPRSAPPPRFPNTLERPTIQHFPPKHADAAKPLALTLAVWPLGNVKSVRLHYRSLNQLAAWKTIDQPPQRQVFTILEEAIDPRWDLQYYFEILNPEGTGWFYPDPRESRPYFVIPVEIPTVSSLPRPPD